MPFCTNVTFLLKIQSSCTASRYGGSRSGPRHKQIEQTVVLPASCAKIIFFPTNWPVPCSGAAEAVCARQLKTAIAGRSCWKWQPTPRSQVLGSRAACTGICHGTAASHDSPVCSDSYRAVMQEVTASD